MGLGCTRSQVAFWGTSKGIWSQSHKLILLIFIIHYCRKQMANFSIWTPLFTSTNQSNGQRFLALSHAKFMDLLLVSMLYWTALFWTTISKHGNVIFGQPDPVILWWLFWCIISICLLFLRMGHVAFFPGGGMVDGCGKRAPGGSEDKSALPSGGTPHLRNFTWLK